MFCCISLASIHGVSDLIFTSHFLISTVMFCRYLLQLMLCNSYCYDI